VGAGEQSQLALAAFLRRSRQVFNVEGPALLVEVKQEAFQAFHEFVAFGQVTPGPLIPTPILGTHGRVCSGLGEEASILQQKLGHRIRARRARERVTAKSTFGTMAAVGAAAYFEVARPAEADRAVAASA
jgi:hypothetical protein